MACGVCLLDADFGALKPAFQRFLEPNNSRSTIRFKLADKIVDSRPLGASVTASKILILK